MQDIIRQLEMMGKDWFLAGLDRDSFCLQQGRENTYALRGCECGSGVTIMTGIDTEKAMLLISTGVRVKPDKDGLFSVPFGHF